MEKKSITFMPGNITAEIKQSDTVLRAAARAGINIRTDCGGMGSCGKCKVKVNLNGKSGFVPACQYPARAGMEVWLSEEGKLRGKAEGKTQEDLAMPENFAADAAPGRLAVSVDVGTTSLAVILWDMEKKRILQMTGRENPQKKCGADIVSRITFAGEAAMGAKLLQNMVTGEIAQMVRESLSAAGRSEKEILRYAVVGNTVMSHLFLGLDPSGLGEAPFTPAFTDSVTKSARALKLPGGDDTEVYIAPNLGGHVGSDITADILALEIKEGWKAGKDDGKARLLVDIGTNGEIVLACGERLLTASAAAGPAFEGVGISCGMRAEDGAVEKVEFEDNKFKLSVIGGGKPVGICGSGIIDAACAMLSAGCMDETGRIHGPGGKARVVLYEDHKTGQSLSLDQQDIRQLQTAKGAVFAAISVLLKRMGLWTSDLEEIAIFGAFGSYIDTANAMDIGLLPRADRKKIVTFSNGAAFGAGAMALSFEARRKAEEIAEHAEHITLAGEEDFQQSFLAALNFGSGKLLKK